MRWFSRPKFCISRLKIHRQKTQMERESSKEYSVSFLNERFSLRNCPSKNSTLFSLRRRAWFVLHQTRHQSFWRNFAYILYSIVEDSTFLKGNFCIYKGFIDYSALKKKHKICLYLKLMLLVRSLNVRIVTELTKAPNFAQL